MIITQHSVLVDLYAQRKAEQKLNWINSVHEYHLIAFTAISNKVKLTTWMMLHVYSVSWFRMEQLNFGFISPHVWEYLWSIGEHRWPGGSQFKSEYYGFKACGILLQSFAAAAPLSKQITNIETNFSNYSTSFIISNGNRVTHMSTETALKSRKQIQKTSSQTRY